MDPLVENDRNENKNTHHGLTDDRNEEHVLLGFGGNSDLHRETPSSTSSSSSSSSSSDDDEDEDFIQLDGTELGKPVVSSGDVASSSLSSPPLVGDGPLAPEFDARGDGLPSAQSPDREQELLSVNLGIFEPTETPPPPAQVMVRSDVPDPFRIPSSVFERTKSTAPMEWSVASNESLFSIHMGGNNSFSRDHAILLGMSGELPSLPLLDLRKDPVQPPTTGTTSLESKNTALIDVASEHVLNEKPSVESPPHCPSTPHSYHSEASTTSINSFAFPILTEGQSGSMKAEPEKRNHSQGLKQLEGNEQQKPMVGSIAWWKSWCSCCSCTYCC